VSIQNFKNKFGENPIYIFMDKLKKLVDENLLDIDGDNIKLTNRGLDLANLVWEEFV
jgi:oxygen-independent coproporphyrinogen-3 oxidase